MTRMNRIWKYSNFLLSIFSLIFISDAFATPDRSSMMDDDFSEESAGFPSNLLARLTSNTCSYNAACYFEVENFGMMDNYVFSMCRCPAGLRCKEYPPVRTNNGDYYLCGDYRPPICKRGELAHTISGLQSIIHCRCKKRLVPVNNKNGSQNFVCGKFRSKIVIKKMHGSEQRSNEFYNFYR